MKRNNSKGYTLIEVLVGIVIFALGMMALASLQGNLAKNSTEASARTVAGNIAEQVIEQLRNFGQITSDGTNHAYEDIVDATITRTRAGLNFSVDMDVTDYYYVNGTFTATKPTGAVVSDMKLVEVEVSWDNDQKFTVNEGKSEAISSGKIKLTDAISSITSPSSGRVSLGSTLTGNAGPPVDYNPGQNPDIVSIQLAANKFKESTTPLPDVIRGAKNGDEYAEVVETRDYSANVSASET